jgi:hypothetical protein
VGDYFETTFSHESGKGGSAAKLAGHGELKIFVLPLKKSFSSRFE